MNKISPQTAAATLFQSYLLRGFDLVIHEYQDKNHSPIYWRNRLKHSITGEKKIFPMRLSSTGEYELKEPLFEKGCKPLYNLPMIIERINEDLFVVEGESCADALIKLGFVATTSGACDSAARADWSSITNRRVIVWRDNDLPGLRYAENVTKTLLALGCDVMWLDLEKQNLTSGSDCIDWIASREGVDVANEILSLPIMPSPITLDNANHRNVEDVKNPNEDDDHKDQSKTLLLIELVKDVDFFHDEQKQAFASFRHKNHLETWPVDSQKFKDWLAHKFWVTHQKATNEAAMRDAISVMKGKSIFDGPTHKVFTRVGFANSKIYINLANEAWQIIEINAEGWKILDEAPVKFRGTQNMQPLPLPRIPIMGDVELLWKHVNINEESKILVLAWLLECFRLDTPFPLLILTGVQGSGKSRTQEILRELVDPSMPNLRSAPKNADDILIASSNNWVVSYNNVSKLSVENQDDLCYLSTGGGFARRRLYTTDEEAVSDIKRPVIINGIGDIITRQDLVDRCVIIEMHSISDTSRRDENQLENNFKADYPLIFTGLLNLLSNILKRLPTMTLESKPRMASFALLGTALEEQLQLEKGFFLKQYRENYSESMICALESSPIAIALLKFMTNETFYRCSFAELLEKLSTPQYRPNMAGWPKSAKGLANILKRQTYALAMMGLKLSFDAKPKNNGYNVTIINTKSH